MVFVFPFLFRRKFKYAFVFHSINTFTLLFACFFFLYWYLLFGGIFDSNVCLALLFVCIWFARDVWRFYVSEISRVEQTWWDTFNKYAKRSFFFTSFANIRNKGIDTCFVLCERFTIAIHQENDLCMSLVSLWILFDRIMFLQSPVHIIQKFNKIGMW